MFLVDSKSTGTTRDQQFFLGLIRAERSGDPDPLTTIHLDFDNSNTYRVNTLYPSSITYTQNTQYAVVGSNCAYIDGTAGIEIQHDPEDNTLNYEELYSFKHTFSGWFRFSSLSGTVPLLGTDYANHPRLLYDSTNYYISAHTLATSSDFEMRWNYQFSVDTWYHICYALQSSNVEGMILWINGTKITRTYVSTVITGYNENNRVNYEPIMARPGDTTLKNQFIGRYVNTYMNGYVDDIRYYIGRIPDSYVQTLYNLGTITISSFTYTYKSITITKSASGSKNWSWSINGVSQGVVLGSSGTTQTITGLSLQNGDIVVVTMSDSSVTETLSGLPSYVYKWSVTQKTSGGNQGTGAVCIVEIDVVLNDGSTISSSDFNLLSGYSGNQTLLDDNDTTPDTTVPSPDSVIWSESDYSVGDTLLEFPTNRTDIDYFRIHWFSPAYTPAIDFYKNGNEITSESHAVGAAVYDPKPNTIDYMVPPTITSFSYTSETITITKSSADATDWSWALNAVSQGTITGATGTSQTLSNIALANGDTIEVIMFGDSLTQNVSGLTTISSFTYSTDGDSITITKSDTEPTDWSWSLNTVDQGTINGSTGTSQTITNLSLANDDIVAVTMSGNTLSQTVSGVTLPAGVNTYTLTDDFSSGGASKITYQLNGISDNEAYSVSVSPNGSYTHDHTLNNLQRGKYTIVFSVADHDNQGSNASYGHYGWVYMTIQDSSGTNMTNYLANDVMTNATSGTNNFSTSSAMYGQFDGSQQNNKQFVITADLEIPETADYKISVFVVSSDNNGTSASAKYNVEIKPPPPKTISVSFDYNIGGATLTHNNPNDVYVYLYDDDTDTLYANPLISWGQSSGDNTWKSYSNTAAVFSGSSCRLVFKLVDGPHVHDTGWADVTIGNTTFTFGANDEQNFLWQNFNSTTLNLSSAVNVNTTSTINSRNAATSNGSAVLIQTRSGNAYFLYYEGSMNSSSSSSGTAWLITPAASV